MEIARAIRTAPTTRLAAEVQMEAVHIDQSTLSTRPGYSPTFLGTGELAVPLPKLSRVLKAKAATLIGTPGDTALHYFNYTVVFHRERKLAIFAAVNTDGAQQQDVGKREGDSWLCDPRIDAACQIGEEFYGKQSTMGIDRSSNPFDRGHLVRRLDGTWGATVEEAKAHGDDTFHFTNCTPQFWSFNQGKQLWAGLEDYTRDMVLKDKSRMIIMNGPVFDGPDAPPGGLPSASAPQHKDPSFGGLQIPKYFWKLFVVVRNGALAASAFVLSQRDQILAIDRIHDTVIFQALSDAEAKVFQVSIADLEKFTGLNFGKLRQADTHEATPSGARAISSLTDIRF